jgi:DNA helicase-4
MRKLAEVWPGEIRKSSTIHAAKGLEADHVVLLELRDVIPFAAGGRLSVPSSLSDDPLLALVMPRRETFAHAEERRLLYVGLSRAKLRVDLICPRLYPSTFATELADYPEAMVLGAPALEVECALCASRAAEVRGRIAWNGRHPLSCTNPTCGFVPPRCERCRSGFLVPQSIGSRLRCAEAMCGHEADPPTPTNVAAPGTAASLIDGDLADEASRNVTEKS